MSTLANNLQSRDCQGAVTIRWGAALTFSGAVAALALILAGCTIGPKYDRPAVLSPAAFKELQPVDFPNTDGWKTGQPKDDAIRGNWWEVFHDPRLNELEEKVTISNQNIAAAAAGYLAAQATIKEARSQFFPTVTAGAGITNLHLVIPAAGAAVGNTYTEYSMPLQASWEPDLWGRVRNTVKASTYAAQASAADLQNVRLAAQADLAADFYELRAQDAMWQVLDSTVITYAEALELNQALYRSGLGSDEAVAQAETQLRAAQAQAASIGILRAQYEHAIALLIGQPASTFQIPVEALKPNAPAIPFGVPADLLERRPDIAAAERAMAQANAQIGIAKAAYYPNITLSASGGPESISITSLPSRFWSVGPALVETIFDGGLRKATVQQYKATYDQTVANYRQTVLTAFQQVEDNLASIRILSQVAGQQDEAIEAAARTLEEATARYQGGLDPYLNVLVAQVTLLNAEQTEVGFREQQMVASVGLIKALGGGWEANSEPRLKGAVTK